MAKDQAGHFGLGDECEVRSSDHSFFTWYGLECPEKVQLKMFGVSGKIEVRKRTSIWKVS